MFARFLCRQEAVHALNTDLVSKENGVDQGQWKNGTIQICCFYEDAAIQFFAGGL